MALGMVRGRGLALASRRHTGIFSLVGGLKFTLQGWWFMAAFGRLDGEVVLGAVAGGVPLGKDGC